MLFHPEIVVAQPVKDLRQILMIRIVRQQCINRLKITGNYPSPNDEQLPEFCG